MRSQSKILLATVALNWLVSHRQNPRAILLVLANGALQVWPGEMRYLTDHRGDLRSDPRNLLPSAKSIICVGKLYNTGTRTAPPIRLRRDVAGSPATHGVGTIMTCFALSSKC